MKQVILERRHTAGDEAASTVVEWRREWQQEVADAVPSYGGDARILANRRDYGRYAPLTIDVLLAFVLGQIVFAIPLFIAAAVIVAATGHQPGGAAGVNGLVAYVTGQPVFTLAGLVVVDGALALVLWLRLRRLRLGWDLVGLGADLRHGAARAILIGLGFGIIAVIVAAGVEQLQQKTGLEQVLTKLGGDPNAQQKALIDPLRHAPTWIVVATVLAGTFVAPAIEEIFYRGYLFRALAVRKALPVAYLLSALVFASSHMLPDQFLPLFAVGLLLCVAYHRTNNLLTSFTAHAFNNGLGFAVFLLQLYGYLH